MRANLSGLAAILMWAILALLTDLASGIPPFQLTAMAFGLASAIGLFIYACRSPKPDLRSVPYAAWGFGIAGLFGYHFLYFSALANAPAVEASLIAYLWPLLIVVGSALLPGETLRWYHICGALIGLIGAAFIVSGKQGFSFEPRYTLGYVLAGLCALTWSSYSLIARRFSAVPTDAVTIFCMASTLLACLCHYLLETTAWPQTTSQWLAVAGLGLMPVGLAFYAWDYGVKNGNIQLLGTASYAAPLLSTIVLIVAGRAEPSLNIVIACILITGGALLGSLDILRKKKQ